uniref:Nicastrin n=1 Tax=Phlebotomus kandelakii TaxID=1109342 RepID=A0A6B2EHY2_9DIPT
MGVLLHISCLLISLLCLADGQRITDKMFSNIAGTSCFRRMNATHVTGCSSSFRGSQGVIHVVKTQEDFEFLFNDPPSPPYAPVIPPHLFTKENILRLKANASHVVSGIVLTGLVTSLKSFSHESRCPNQFGGLIRDQTCSVDDPDNSWNPFGTGLLQEFFPFPIYFVSSEKEVKKITECFDKFNNFDLDGQHERPLCSIEINSFMSAAVNSEVCMRRSNMQNNLAPTTFCDPLQGRNVFATLFPREIVEPEQRKVDPEEKIILLSARMDTASMFDGEGAGAMGSLVPYTVLMSAAQLLAKLLPEKRDSGQPNVLFMLFNGESFDYIGSQRFVYDLQQGAFPSKLYQTKPLALDNIKLLVDLGSMDTVRLLNLFHATDFPQASEFGQLMSKYSSKFSMNVTTMNRMQDNMPPTSAQSFLREDINFPAVVINSPPTNRFYHSIFDDDININYVYGNTSKNFLTLEDLSSPSPDFTRDSIQLGVRNISSIVAFSLYEMITGEEYRETLGASSLFADEFLYCFLMSTECPLIEAIVPVNTSLPPYPPQRYISVHRSNAQRSVIWTYNIFGLTVGQKLEGVAKENCTHSPRMWFPGFGKQGECHLTTMNISLAISPAFKEAQYNWTSGRYSSWTESTWSAISARIYLRPSTHHEALTLAIGLTVMVLSFIVVFIINTKSDVLFGNSPSSEVISIPARC